MLPARVVLLILTGTLAIQGCKNLQHTSGACDCNPPPVESLLTGPCPSHGTPVSLQSGPVAGPTVDSRANGTLPVAP